MAAAIVGVRLRRGVGRDAAWASDLDLGRLARLQDQRDSPVTPAVHAYYALHSKHYVTLLMKAGARSALGDMQRWLSRSAPRRAPLGEFALNPVISAEQSLVVLRSYHLPGGTPYSKLHDQLKVNRFVIYAGQGELTKLLFRISTVVAVTSADINRLLKCFAQRR